MRRAPCGAENLYRQRVEEFVGEHDDAEPPGLKPSRDQRHPATAEAVPFPVCADGHHLSGWSSLAAVSGNNGTLFHSSRNRPAYC